MSFKFTHTLQPSNKHNKIFTSKQSRIIKKVGGLAFCVAIGIQASFFSPLTVATNFNPTPERPSFIAFESGPVRPVALCDNDNRLYVTNISDNRLEIFDNSGTSPANIGSIAVGLEPVAVACDPSDSDIVYVANHLSDSVSVIDVSNPQQAKVIKTLLVGDEPRDIVIAQPDGLSPRLFVTTAHRGQHRTHPSIADVPGAGDPKLNDPGVGRADVWVFDTHNLHEVIGGKPLKIMSFFADTPRALAVSNDQSKVYVAAYFSQNRTAVVPPGVVCHGFEQAEECETQDGFIAPDGQIGPAGGGLLPGGNPGPSTNIEGVLAPEVALIVKFDPNAGPADDDLNTGQFVDELGRDWNNGVRARLPDKDVFAVDVYSLEEIAFHQTVGTTLFNIAVNPKTGTLYVSNTEANNLQRFEGAGTIASSVQGHLAESRITVITNPNQNRVNGSNVNSRHLNKHIDYSVLKAPEAVRERSLATPLEMVVSANGETLYVAAFGSQKIGVFNTSELENDSFVPSVNAHIELSAGGPGGLALSQDGQKLYVYTRFDNGLSVIDTRTQEEVGHVQMFNPEPEHIVQGRPFLYDARLTSSNGEASCSSCHIFGDNDYIAWDLGEPEGLVSESTIPVNLQEILEIVDSGGTILGALTATEEELIEAMPSAIGGFIDIEEVNGDASFNQFHPLKGPMTTQTLRGISTHGAMHWRGDRVSGVFNDHNPSAEDAFDEELSFNNFIVAFEGLNGREEIIEPEQMQMFTDFMLSVFLPPNPVRNIDNSLTEEQRRGRDFYFGEPQVETILGLPIVALRRSDGVAAGAELVLSTIMGRKIESGFTCNGCHVLDPAKGFFGTNGNQSFEGETQIMKIAHLRNDYTKVGAFGLNSTPFISQATGSPDMDLARFDFQGDQIKAFGLLHDGTADTVENFLGAEVFQESAVLEGFGESGIESAQQRRELQAFVHAFDTDLAPIVGQQVTVNSIFDSNIPRVQLMQLRSKIPFNSLTLGGLTTEADLVAHCINRGTQTGFLYEGAGFFRSDRDSLYLGLLGVMAACDGPATFTAVPPGSGERIALDRDLDGRYNQDT